jgi:membrane protein
VGVRQEAHPGQAPARGRAASVFRRPGGAAVRWFLQHPFATVRRTARGYMDDNCSTYAAAMAYYALFSLIPLSIITLSIFGLVLSDSRIEQFIFDQLPLEDSPGVHQDVHNIVDRSKVISGAGVGIGAIVLAWSASGVFTAVRRGLNATRHNPQRPFWRGKLLDLGLVPAFGLLILVFVGVMVAAQVILEEVSGIGPVDVRSNDTLRAISVVVTSTLSFVAFMLLYRWVPAIRPRWREAATGAICAAVLFEGLRTLYGFVFALTPFSRENALYAGFGTALTFLLWMYMNASILLIGAEFSRAIWEPRIARPSIAVAEAPPGA